MQKVTFRAMHCQMMAAVDRDSPRVSMRLEEVPHWFAHWEQRLSRFRPDSELSQINRLGGQEVRVSALMQEVLRASLRASRESDGLVSPAVLNALEESGYNRSFDELSIESKPLANAARGTTRNAGLAAAIAPEEALQLKAHARLVKLAPGVRLDLGGIAKGWAADRSAQRLRRLGPALVNAGGDISVSGPLSNGEAWPIGITDPFAPEKQLDLVMLHKGGLATSGRDYRRWLKDRDWQHHIIDPRTGRPAQTDVLTATVVAPSAQAAEMAAKAVLILGSWQGIAWLDRRPKFAGMMVLEDGAILHSRRWMDHIWR